MGFIVFAVLSVLAVFLFMQQPKFGKAASGIRLERMKRSFHHNKEFENLSPTPSLKEGTNMVSVMIKFFFSPGKRNKPAQTLPSVKENLHNLLPDEDLIVWFGHSSYFIQADGKKFLVDPVFSGAASPLSFTTRSFPGSDRYTAADMPDIDYLVITHDHWDHLDYETVTALRPKVKQVITGLGTAAHLEYWKYNPADILEFDWWEQAELAAGFRIIATPARHFSGRGFTRNRNTWNAFILETPSRKLYLGGDSGFDTHFEEIGDKYGPFDLAILECGQYNEDWPYIHMLPHEWITAANALKAKALLPVHWGKFALSMHEWDEPIKAVTAEAAKQDFPVWTPRIGEKTKLDAPQYFTHWWNEIN